MNLKIQKKNKYQSVYASQNSKQQTFHSHRKQQSNNQNTQNNIKLKASFNFNCKIKLLAILIKNKFQNNIQKAFQNIKQSYSFTINTQNMKVSHQKQPLKSPNNKNKVKRTLSNLNKIKFINEQHHYLFKNLANKYQSLSNLQLKLAFNKIVHIANGYHSAQIKFKNFIILLKRIQINQKQKAFLSILKYAKKQPKKIKKIKTISKYYQDNNIQKEKSYNLHQRQIKTKLLFKNIQNLYFKKINQAKSYFFNSLYQQKQKRNSNNSEDNIKFNIRSFSIILTKLFKNQYFNTFNQIYSYGIINQVRNNNLMEQNLTNDNNNINIKSDEKFKIKINMPSNSLQNIQQQKIHEMTIQLQQKNESINKLTQQLRQIKRKIAQRNNQYSLIQNENFKAINQDQSYSYFIPKPQKSLDFYGYHSNSITNLLIRNDQNKKSMKNLRNSRQNKLMKKDSSLSSLLLNSSFLSFKSKDSRASTNSLSKKKENNILDGLMGSRRGFIEKTDCRCIFRNKYKQYKTLNESIKNQLQILKKELQVAKDLNQHFENELRLYGGRPQQDQQDELQKLNKNLLEINKERQEIKQKINKYQKHISSMKSEFKKKMQQMYRKVKKDM